MTVRTIVVQLALLAVSAPLFLAIIYGLFYLAMSIVMPGVPPAQPPAHEPKITKDPILFSAYLDSVSQGVSDLSYEGRSIKTLCVAATYAYPERNDLRFSSYIIDWLWTENGKVFLIFFDSKNKYIGAIESDGKFISPAPLNWGQCIDIRPN